MESDSRTRAHSTDSGRGSDPGKRPGVVWSRGTRPEPMMRAVAAITKEHGVNAHVSLETPMACGIGICFSCVALVADEQGNPDYRRTCVEGPVFDAHQLIWE